MLRSDYEERLTTLSRQVAALEQRINAANDQVFHSSHALRSDSVTLLYALLDELQAAHAELHIQQTQIDTLHEQVHTTQQRYAEILELASDGYIMTNASGQILEANRAAALLLNVNAAALVGQSLFSFLTEQPQARPIDLEKVTAAKQPKSWNMVLSRQDASPGNVAVTVWPVPVSASQSPLLCWLLRDISQHVWQSRALQASEMMLSQINADLEAQMAKRTAELQANQALLQAILDYSPMTIYVKDTAGNFLIVNREAVRIMRLSVDQIVGKNEAELFPAEVVSEWRAHKQQVLERRQSMTFEEVLPDEDGLHTYLSFRFPLFNPSGEIYAIGGIGTDITERKRAEEALRESEQRYRDISEIISDFAYAFRVEPDGTLTREWITGASKRITGFLPEEIEPAEDWYSLVHPDDLPYVLQSQEPVLSGQSDVREFRIIARDGEIRWLRSYVQPVWDAEQGRVVRFYGAAQDITERKRAEEALRESEQWLRLITENLDDVVWLATPDEKEMLYVSSAYETVFGLSCASLYADPCSYLELVHPDDRDQLAQIIGRDASRRNEIIFRIVRPDGILRWLWASTRPIYNEQDEIVWRVGVIKDVTERKAYEAEIERLAFTDPLTSLVNRRRLYDLGNAALSSSRIGGEQVALVYLDLDRFKMVNDTMGHDAGDDLLVQVAERLLLCMRKDDMLARIGGDEFAVLLMNTETQQAVAVAERMLESLQQPFVLEGDPIYIGGSMGIAVGIPNQIPFSMLLTHADIAMYHAKEKGGGVEVYDKALVALAHNQLSMETDLHLALATDEFTLYYQPVIDVVTGQMVSVEALLRWMHPQRGLLLPAAFLPLAADIGLIRQIDHWVLHAALTQASIWATADNSVEVAINLSTQSLRDVNLINEVQSLLRTTGALASSVQLCIELHGYASLGELETVQRVLMGLRDLGVHIGLDGFSSDYASLANLHKLPIDRLKVDSAFTAGIGRDARDESVVQAILALGQGLGINVIVEGVEDKVQMSWLQAAGCTRMQGYLIGHPVPPDDLDSMPWSL